MPHKAAVKISSNCLAGLKGTSLKIDIREAGVGKIAVFKTYISETGFIEKTADKLTVFKSYPFETKQIAIKLKNKHSFKKKA